MVFSLTDNLNTSKKRRVTDSCLTQLTAHVPVELGVEIGWVDAIGWGINPWQLPLVKSQELFSSVIDQRLRSGLAEGQNVTWSAWRVTWVRDEKMSLQKRLQCPYLFVCVGDKDLVFHLHLGTPVRQQSWWTPPGLTDLYSVSSSSSSFHP